MSLVVMDITSRIAIPDAFVYTKRKRSRDDLPSILNMLKLLIRFFKFMEIVIAKDSCT